MRFGEGVHDGLLVEGGAGDEEVGVMDCEGEAAVWVWERRGEGERRRGQRRARSRGKEGGGKFGGRLINEVEESRKN